MIPDTSHEKWIRYPLGVHYHITIKHKHLLTCNNKIQHENYQYNNLDDLLGSFLDGKIYVLFSISYSTIVQLDILAQRKNAFNQN